MMSDYYQECPDCGGVHNVSACEREAGVCSCCESIWLTVGPNGYGQVVNSGVEDNRGEKGDDA